MCGGADGYWRLPGRCCPGLLRRPTWFGKPCKSSSRRVKAACRPAATPRLNRCMLHRPCDWVAPIVTAATRPRQTSKPRTWRRPIRHNGRRQRIRFGPIRCSTRRTVASCGSSTPGHDLSILRTPFGAKRFERDGDRLIQRSMVEEDKQWFVSQVKNSVTQGHPEYNQKSRLAKTMQKDAETWGRCVSA